MDTATEAPADNAAATAADPAPPTARSADGDAELLEEELLVEEVSIDGMCGVY